MIVIFYFIFVVLISFALGQRIFRWMGVKFANELESFVFSFPLGMSALAYTTFFLGLFGFLYKFMLVSVLFIFFILLIKDIKIILLGLLIFLKGIDKNKLKKKYKIGFNFFSILLASIALLILLNFIISFSPPWHFDVVAYHLAVQKIYIEHHQIIYLPFIFFSNLPPLVDTISLMGLLLHNGILSNLFAYSLGVTLVFAIYSFCLRFFDKKIALLASFIFYSLPMTIKFSSTAHVDIQLALFFLLSYFGLFLYFKHDDSKWLVLCAIFAGLGVSSKIWGGVAIIGILVLLGWHLVQRLAKNGASCKNAFFKMAIFCLIVFIITSPWLLKNYLFTGNPVWPAFNEIFKGKNWDQKHQEGLASIIRLRETSVINYIRLPWDIHTQQGKDINNIDEDEGIGPYFLAFLPIYFFLRKKSKIINMFFALLAIYITSWFFLSYMLRYLIFAVPLVAIISAYVIKELLGNNLLSRILKLLLIFTFCFSLLIWIGSNAKELPVALGFETKDAFNSKYPGAIYKASKFINSNLPESSKILLFRDTRGFFLERDYVWADPLYQTVIDYSRINDGDDFYKELKNLGITHILVNDEFDWHGAIALRYNKRISGIKDDFLKKHTLNIYDNDGIIINEIKK